MMDLASELAGGRVVECNDEFFAEAKNLIRVSAPEWRDGVFTDRGKWMDGWETRRRREPGHDWCILALGIAGRVHAVTVDTSHFTGNYPEAFSLEACGVGSDERLSVAEWVEILPRTALEGDSVATFEVTDPHRITHLRLNIFPDGGVARLRIEGTPIPSMQDVCPDGLTDLASAVLGGEALAASDKHYSDPSNLLQRTAPAGMWDGWETRRRRGPGHDWAEFRLGLPGEVERFVIDTTHFKGNAPGWVSLHVSGDGSDWRQAVEKEAISADAVNSIEVGEPVAAAFIRLSLHPDGGVARIRALGRPDPEPATSSRVSYLNALFDSEAHAFFRAACAASAWVEHMVAGRPYPTAAEVLAAAESAFDLLDDGDWLEAFLAHPRIGERGDAHANREQSGTASASRELLARLSAVNRVYENEFGFTYIVHATGKTTEQMLEIAEARLANTRSEEIANASGEQRQITRTRLRRMLCMEKR